MKGWSERRGRTVVAELSGELEESQEIVASWQLRENHV